MEKITIRSSNLSYKPMKQYRVKPAVTELTNRRFVEKNHQMRPEQSCFSNKNELISLNLIESI